MKKKKLTVNNIGQPPSSLLFAFWLFYANLSLQTEDYYKLHQSVFLCLQIGLLVNSGPLFLIN